MYTPNAQAGTDPAITAGFQRMEAAITTLAQSIGGGTAPAAGAGALPGVVATGQDNTEAKVKAAVEAERARCTALFAWVAENPSEKIKAHVEAAIKDGTDINAALPNLIAMAQNAAKGEATDTGNDAGAAPAINATGAGAPQAAAAAGDVVDPGLAAALQEKARQVKAQAMAGAARIPGTVVDDDGEATDGGGTTEGQGVSHTVGVMG